MRKIPESLENPIDNLIIKLVGYSSPFFKKLGFSPNGITTLSMIFGLMSIAALYKNHVIYAVIFMFISYVFDNLDGFYARKYDMVTKFGDCYDHIKDIVVFLIFIYLLYKRNKSKLTVGQWLIVAGVLLVFLLAFMMYFACQERYYDKADEIPTIGWLQKLVPSKEAAEKWLGILRFFGLGTFILVLLSFTVWIEYKK